MVERVYKYIEEFHMIEKGDTVIAGVSGGADSVCLFHVLLQLTQRIGFSLSVVHIEHGIRGREALEDMEFVKNLCQSYSVPCNVYRYDVKQLAKEAKLTEEEAGRKVRYASFAQEKKKYSGNVKIAVAHNMNDNAETMLMHLIRGSGISGLCGIEPVREDIIRPLLFLRREEIETYLNSIGQPYCTDSTNLATDYTRNKIRLQVLPKLSQVNPQAVWHIHQATEKLTEANRFLQQQVEDAYQHIVTKEQDKFILQVQPLEDAEDYLKGEVIKRVLTECGGSSKNIGNVHIQSVLKLTKRVSGKEVDLPYQMQAQRVYETICIQHKKPLVTQQEKEVLIPGSGQYNVPEREETFEVSVEIREKHKKNVNKLEKTYTKCFDYDKIEGSLVIRTRKPGDYLIIDEKGHRQSLKSFFINEKIEREVRNQILLVAEGSHILWIVGYRCSMGCRVDESTERILKIQRVGGNQNE